MNHIEIQNLFPTIIGFSINSRMEKYNDGVYVRVLDALAIKRRRFNNYPTEALAQKAIAELTTEFPNVKFTLCACLRNGGLAALP